MIPPQITNRLNEAIAHHNAGRLDRAESIYRQLAPVAPKCAILFELWGRVAERKGRAGDALRLLTQALRLDESSAGAASMLAAIHVAAGRPGEGEKVLRRLLQRNEKCADGWTSLGYVLKVQGRLDEAVSCYRRATEIEPKSVDRWVNLGLTVALSGRNFEALRYHDRALSLDPDSAAAHYGRAQALHKTYRLQEAVEEYDRFLQHQPGHLEARSYRMFALQNLGLSKERMLAEHRVYGTLLAAGPASLPGYDFSPDRRLRVGILSPDLRTHSCAYFLEPLIRHLDPAQFELYLYHDHFIEDGMSARLKKYAAVWRNFVGRSHSDVEKVIRADKPDVLIDLAGHIGNSIRLPIFAKRLAPVQITYLGYPDTTGVPAMDFRFTDAVADPVGEGDAFATEKLVRFAPVAWAYQPPIEAPAVEPPPCASGAPVVFGCFNNPTKFTDELFAMWGRLLDRVPNSRLVLKGRDFEEAPVREHMLGRMAKAGIATDRLELLPRTDGTAEHLKQYGRIDVALDTFPYNGTTTTCEALWMGRPVVTLRGDRHAARVGASLLSAVGHPEWVAADADRYVEIAAALSQNPSGLAGDSASLRADLQRSPLMDDVGQSAAFSTALRRCWKERAGAA